MSLPLVDARLDHQIDLYEPGFGDETCRFILGTSGKKPLVVLDLNLSYADKEKSDRTITKIKEYARRHNCDSFIMLNLSAQRTPQPSQLCIVQDEVLHHENLSHIASILRRFQSVEILAAWGENINSRPYLKYSLRDIVKLTQVLTIRWLQIGDSLTLSGHPRHPSRGGYLPLMPFDIEDYLRSNFHL